MSTPTFPVTHVDDRDERLTAALDAFRQGEIRGTDVARLSDLRRDELKRVRGVWRDLPEEHRIALVRWMNQLSEDRVELTFGRMLRHALQDESAAVRQLALGAMWEDEDRDLVSLLTTLLRDDPDQGVRAEAAALLGRCVDRIATEESDPTTTGAVRESLLACWHDPVEAPIVRRRALEAVSGLGADPVIQQAIAGAYDDGDATLTAGAVRAMGRTVSASYFGTILAELASDDAELRYEAALAAGELSDERAVPELISLLDDDDVDVKLAAAGALGRIGGKAAVQALEAHAEAAAEVEDPVLDQDVLSDTIAEAMLSVDPLQAPPVS
ncbi:MAG: HEAT repeat domain-containing protein [Thermomicrobiales bacterium]